MREERGFRYAQKHNYFCKTNSRVDRPWGRHKSQQLTEASHPEETRLLPLDISYKQWRSDVPVRSHVTVWMADSKKERWVLVKRPIEKFYIVLVEG